MRKLSLGRIVAGGFVVASFFTFGAHAHHGWNWAEGEQTELAGTILEVYVGPPHPSLEVETADEGVWTVELGNPTQSANAGFTEDSAEAGDEVVVLGHRSSNQDENRIKAVRITLDGENYDFYPDRIREN